MVASVGSSLQSGNVNPFQKQTDEQDRNSIGKSAQNGRNTQEAKLSSTASPAVSAKRSEDDPQENSFAKAKQDNDNDEDDRPTRKARGSLLDLKV